MGLKVTMGTAVPRWNRLGAAAPRVDGRARRATEAVPCCAGLQDMMNRTLYALTLVTFLATPITLLTGTFGMNFSDMHELVLHPRPPPIP